jgi:rhodanese-related sulfurtransferase
MAPFPIEQILGKGGAYLIYLLIGVSFGVVLEMSGFAKSSKLAAQFYFKEQTVLKVMFTAIVVAMVLIFLTSGLGWLDYNRVWVNTTYLWPGIVGGLIMGVGFIIGGFCPGTSLVAAATLKLDGIFFALGALTGIFIFGESIDSLAEFWNSSYMGRFILPEWLGLSTGLVVFLIVLMALFMFWGAEQLERIFGGRDLTKEPRIRYAGAGVLVAAAIAVLVIGQPTVADKWQAIAAEKEPLLINREVQIHPGELLDMMHNDQVKLMMLDVRDEVDYNLFHIVDAKFAPLDSIPVLSKSLLAEPDNTVIVVMSNDETHATEAWKILTAESVLNVYILEGGINYWLDIFGHAGHEQCFTAPVSTTAPGNDELRHIFNAAIGDRDPAADPDLDAVELDYVPKVKLQTKKATTGGCG